MSLPLLALAACQTPAPVDRPCGVIIDSLIDVQGATPADVRRIDRHFERGVAAGCWTREKTAGLTAGADGLIQAAGAAAKAIKKGGR